MSGGDVGARDGTLAIMVGGGALAFERARPLFELLGRRVTHMGASGAGQMTKLANQIAVALALEAAAEAIKFGQAGGLDASRVVEAIGAGAAGSWQLSRILGPQNNRRRLSARVLYQADSQGPAAGGRGGA